MAKDWHGKSRKTILWWGRSNPNYSRNEILTKSLNKLGFDIVALKPKISAFGFEQALYQKVPRPDMVWVPCFRQRDFFAARRFARWHKVPLLFDPLISSYDKRVFEFHKLREGSRRARRLKGREKKMFQSADVVLADTQAHKDYFEQELGAKPDQCFVVPVGANEQLFTPQAQHSANDSLEVFFYGSFLPLHGVETIIQAARICQGVRWTLLGGGTLKKKCEELAGGLKNLCFEDPIPYRDLPARIGRADIVLGVFGSTPKAGRVIPNKVFQALACARPVITRSSLAYPPAFQKDDSGVVFVCPGDSKALAESVEQLLVDKAGLSERGMQALKSFQTYFSQDHITELLYSAISSVSLRS